MSTDLLAAIAPGQRVEILQLLDKLSRPLSRREIERALAPRFTRRDREKIVPVLMEFDLIAILPKPGADND